MSEEKVRAQEIKFDIVPYTRGRVLDVGARQKLFNHFICLGHPDLQLFGDKVADAVFTAMFWDTPLDKIDLPAVVGEWWRVLKKDGNLVVYMPSEHHEKFMKIIRGFGPWKLLANNIATDKESALIVIRKGGTRMEESIGPINHGLRALVIRYGGIGDMIQISSVFPGLKAQGYSITVNTYESGKELLQHNPYVDDFLIQDKDQVDYTELGLWWEYLKSKYDRVINFTQSVEAACLALPGQIMRYWPKEARHAFMNHNYLELAHKIAEVPFEPAACFFPTDEEIAAAKRERKKIGGSICILWSLAGSSIHKTWPHLDRIIARLLLDFAGVRIILVGDELCQLLERGWENEPRVICRSGKWKIRDVLTFAIHSADLVIGGETGILNAVGLEKVPKIITLSHSTVDNLTKHWRNTTALVPASTPCYPCHMLHYNDSDCPRDNVKEGTARCQADITVDQMWFAVRRYLPQPLEKTA